jgi:hypothetical protein
MKPSLRKKISKPSAAKGHEPAFREIIGLIQSGTPNLIGPLEDGSLGRPHPGPLPRERESLSNPSRLSMLCGVSPRIVLLAGRTSKLMIASDSPAGERSFPLSSGERAGVRASVHTHLPNLESELVCAVKAQSKSKFVPP